MLQKRRPIPKNNSGTLTPRGAEGAKIEGMGRTIRRTKQLRKTRGPPQERGDRVFQSNNDIGSETAAHGAERLLVNEVAALDFLLVIWAQIGKPHDVMRGPNGAPIGPRGPMAGPRP